MLDAAYNRIAGRSIERLAAPSDGIFAVAMTLLVLDLHIPLAEAIPSDRDLLHALAALALRLLVYIMSFLTLAMTPGSFATEDRTYDPESAGAARGSTENTMRMLASQGVRTSIIRLPPVVHGESDRNGLVPQLIKIARKKRESAYVGDGSNRWPAVHKLDAARLFRLALEKGPAGAAYHGVAEEGIPFREIAATIGQQLKVPIVSKSLEEAAKQFSFLSTFVPVDNPTSSALTQQRLGWAPSQPNLMSDLQRSGYFQT